ncbi:putative membrane protein [Exiguobacterium sp. S17]|nr:putative membrane protein [Exiguobacterium sp. S17]
METRHPRASLFKLLGVGALLIGACVLLVEYLHPTNVISDTLLQATMTAVPIFVTSIVWIRLRRIDRQPEV